MMHAPNLSPKQLSRARIKAGQWLVEDQPAMGGSQTLRQLEPAHHAAESGTRQTRRKVEQLHRVQRFVDDRTVPARHVVQRAKTDRHSVCRPVLPLD